MIMGGTVQSLFVKSWKSLSAFHVGDMRADSAGKSITIFQPGGVFGADLWLQASIAS